jgi:hypothetical protein
MAYPKHPTSVPNIGVLRQQLGYSCNNREISGFRWKEVHDSASKFRKGFTTEKGLKGTALVDWRSQKHQDALAEMTHTFLEVDGNGSLYWPNDDTYKFANRLTYSTD